MSAAAIPFVLHQIGRDGQVPPHLEPFRSSWTYWNPDLEVILWTDASLRTFIAEHAAQFLPIFDGYSHGVCRADLGRYLLLQHCGGIYADLDCQCLQPLAPLLEGHELVVAPEPEIHHQQKNVLERGLQQIICPSFMASVPAHPLWGDVLAELSRFSPADVLTPDDVLDATGPFMLSRVFAAKPGYASGLVSADLIYPFTKTDCWEGQIFDPLFWSRRSFGAFVAHYWDGSWFRAGLGWRAGVPSRAPVQLQLPLQPVARPGVVSRNTGQSAALPLISCWMVTVDQGPQVELAVDCFLAQTYPNRELILVDTRPDSGVGGLIAGKQSTLIRYLPVDSEVLTLGYLCNMALDNSIGVYVCCWSDCDLHDPLRLEVQYQTLVACGAQASVLARSLSWWPWEQKLALSGYGDWQNSLLCERSLMPRYAPSFSGNDSEVLDSVKSTIQVARIDLPRLCIRIRSASLNADQDDGTLRQAAAIWQGHEAERLEQELGRRLPLARYRQNINSRPLPTDSLPLLCRDTRGEPTLDSPSVLILTPVRNGAPYLNRYTSLLERLSYAAEKLSLGLLEGDSSDGTYECLEQLRPRLLRRFRKVGIHRHDLYPPASRGERWQASLQRDRRERLAQIRNRLLMMALEDEDWVLWLDVDVCDYPEDLIQQLLAARRDIVTANCLRENGEPYDLNSFRSQASPVEMKRHHDADVAFGSALWDQYYLDGLLQPPAGLGRLYVDDFSQQSLVELDAVGGTVLLVRADLHRHGLNFPAYPIHGLIETEALSLVAREQGVRSWALPQLIVRHV
jgi:glycosyltransferase involved in cell wall biosynthesis